uniref:PA domain-containing protein n=1 Tax=Oryzias sinensis TaxID=183150 RepID=A0A8C7Y058_9TELE
MSVCLSVCPSFFYQNACLTTSLIHAQEWYTAFVNITYIDPVTSAVKTEKTECGRYGEHSPKREVKGQVLLPATPQDRQACDPNVRFPRAAQSGGAWVALVAAGNCSCQDKIRNVADSNSSAVVIYNTGNDSITIPHPGRKHQPLEENYLQLL